MSDILRQHWQGVSSEEIAAGQERHTTEDVEDAVEKERAALEDSALDRIMQRAEAGEVASVEWLEKRGFINMPYKRSEESTARRPRTS